MRLPGLKGFDEQALQKYVKNTGWLMFGKVLSMVVGFVVARYLGAFSFGDLSFADAFTTIIAAVGALGLDSFIIREIINEPQHKEEILGTSLALRLGINLLLVPLTAAVYLGFHHLSAHSGPPLTWIIVILSFASFFKSFNVIDSYFQSQVSSKYVVKVQNICVVLSALIKVVLVLLNLPVIWFAAALTFDSIMLSAGLVMMYRNRGFSIRSWTYSASRASGLLKQSFPLILSAVMVSIYMKIDQVMLKEVSSTAVGIYSAAARLSEAWYFIPIAVVTSVFPAIIHARKTDPQRYIKRLTNLYDLMVVISLPVALLISFLGTDIIHLLYGNAYAGAGQMLSVHIWSGVFVFLGSASSQYLLAEGFTMVSFQRTGLGALVNIALNLWLIPLYGGMGASVATLIACFVSTFYLLLLPKTRAQGLLLLKALFLISVAGMVLDRLKGRNRDGGQHNL